MHILVTRFFSELRNAIKNIEKALYSWLFWGFCVVGRMGSRGFWHWGRQWYQLILFVCLQVEEVFQFHIITHHIDFISLKFGGILKFLKIREFRKQIRKIRFHNLCLAYTFMHYCIAASVCDGAGLTTTTLGCDLDDYSGIVDNLLHTWNSISCWPYNDLPPSATSRSAI